MPNPLSAVLRHRFPQHFYEGLSGREIGHPLLLSAASATSLAQNIRHSISLYPVPNSRMAGRGRRVPFHVFLAELVRHGPDISLKGLQSAQEHPHGVRATVLGIIQALMLWRYTYQKNELHCGERKRARVGPARVE